MNKRIRIKKEKMRLARLRAAELGQVFTEMDDDATVLAYVEAHKNDSPESSNDDELFFDESDDDDEELVYDPVYENDDDDDDTDDDADEESLKNEAHEAAIAGRKRAQEQLDRENEQLEKEAKEKAIEFAKSTGCYDDEKIIEDRKTLDENYDKNIEDDKNSLELKAKQMANDLELEKVREIEQYNLIDEALSEKSDDEINNDYDSKVLLEKLKLEEEQIKLNLENKKSNLKSDILIENDRFHLQSRLLESALKEIDNSPIDYDSAALYRLLKREEEMIEKETMLKDKQRIAEKEIEKTRKSTQSRYLAQALLSLSQLANKEDDNNEDIPSVEVKSEEVAPLEVKSEEVAPLEVESEEIEPIEVQSKEESTDKVEPISDDENIDSNCNQPVRKIKITRSSLNGKDILLVKRDVAKAAGLDDKNNSLTNNRLEKTTKPITDEQSDESKKTSENHEGISIVNEDGIEYVTVNGNKIDTKHKVISTLGLNEDVIKKLDHQEITKDDKDEETPLEDTESTIRAELKRTTKKKKRKTIFIWIIIIALLIGGTYIYNFYNINRRMPWTAAKLVGDAAKTFTEVKVEEQSTKPKVAITGSLEANNLQTVVLRTDGAIKSINVKEGDAVKKDDILVTVDDTNAQYTIADLESQLKSAKLTGNKNNVRLLELRLENAKNNLEYTMAKANFDGVVAEQGWEVGDYNSLSLNNSNNMIIADLSKFKATVVIDELDIGYVKVGDEVELSFDSLPGTIVDAYVSSIPMLGYYSQQGFGVLNVEITIPNPPRQLKTGFTFAGNIISDKEESIVVVSQSAIISSGDKNIVKMKMPDGSIKDVTVTIRYLGENKCQILSGDVYVGDILLIENAVSFADQTSFRKKR